MGPSHQYLQHQMKNYFSAWRYVAMYLFCSILNWYQGGFNNFVSIHANRLEGNYMLWLLGYCDQIYPENILPRRCLGKLFHSWSVLVNDVSKGGYISYDATKLDAFSAALVKFSSEVTDPKATMIGTFLSIFGNVSTDTLRYSDCVTQYCIYWCW